MPDIPGTGYWVEKAALLHPRRTALVSEGERVDYRTLRSRVRRAAAALEGLGVGPGDRLGLLLPNGLPYVELLLAAGRTGAVAVPLNLRLTPRELAHPVEDAGIEVLFAGEEQRETAEGLAADAGCRLVEVPSGYRRLCDRPSGGPDGPGAGAGPCPPMSELPGGDDPALIVYTSGTTGTPKGALLAHQNLFWNALNDILGLGITWRDVTLTVLPLFHVGGIGLFTLPTLLAGGTVVLPRAFEPAEALRLVEEERVTLFLGVPTVHKMLVEDPAFDEADLSSLRLAYNGGDRCPLEVVERYRERGVPFGGGYGLTETSPSAFLAEPDQLEEALRAPGFMGKPAFGMDARLAGPDGDDPGPGRVGEVLVRGGNLFDGYWGLPEETEASFTDGWFHTGDLAVREEDGFWFIAGRKKEMIKSGGENVYPAEVEAVLREHPEVADACVVGRPHPKWVEVPFAVVEAEGGRPPDPDALESFCRERLAKFKVPRGFAVLDELPRTSIGKPDRALLERRYGAGEGAEEGTTGEEAGG